MELEEFLTRLGLSQYEKQVYLALLKLGRVKSRVISKESKVSYGRIYEILDKLEQKGLVSCFPTEPKSFEAIEPRIAFKVLLHRRVEELDELKSKIPELKVPAKKEVVIEEKTIVLHGKQKQLAMAMQLTDRAKKEVLDIPGVYEPSQTNIITLRRAISRGVKARMLLGKVTRKNRYLIKENCRLGQEIRQRQLPGLRLHISDRQEALLSIVDPNTGERISIYTSNKDFANSMAVFFDSLWEKSKSIKI